MVSRVPESLKPEVLLLTILYRPSHLVIAVGNVLAYYMKGHANQTSPTNFVNNLRVNKIAVKKLLTNQSLR